jgi:hypothetical protein
MSYAPVPRYSREEILSAIDRNKELWVITILAVIDLKITGYMLLFSIDFHQIQVIHSLSFPGQETLIHLPEHTAAVRKHTVISFNGQLWKRLILIKSIVWHMALFALLKYYAE